MMLLCCFLHTRKGEMTGIYFVDSTPIEVCLPARTSSHKVFEGLVGWGKNSVGWHFGFKLHLLAGLLAYTYQKKKPALDLNMKGLSALPPAIF
ncbi:MAG: transposase [Leptolyngbyaceae cyanobacterium]